MEIDTLRTRKSYWDDSQDAMEGAKEAPASRFVRGVTDVEVSHTFTSGVE